MKKAFRNTGVRRRIAGATVAMWPLCTLPTALIVTPSPALAASQAIAPQEIAPIKPRKTRYTGARGRVGVPAAVAGAGISTAAPVPTPEQAELAKLLAFDRFNEKGWVLPNPSVADSVLRDAGGFRSSLAAAGFGFTFLNLNAFAVNMLGNAPYRPQVYVGQRPTADSRNFFTLNYDLGRLGNPGAQFVIGGNFNADTWEPAGPRGARFSRLHIYQPLFDDRVSVKFGFMNNDLEFVGLSVGGSIVGGTQGPNAVLPFQVGLARLGVTAPSVNIRTKITDTVYHKVAIQRSTNPDGVETDVRENPIGLAFYQPRAGTLVINELGYKQDAAPGSRSMWFRGGGIYNNSNYFDFRRFRNGESNSLIYAAGDYQLTTPSTTLPFQGFYAGATAMFAPPEPNLFQNYYEGRLYGIGVIPTRPFDLTSFVVSRTDFSDDVRGFFRTVLRQDTFPSTTSFTLSHAYRAASGVYVSPGISYTIHPSATTKAKDALSFLLNINLVL